MMSFAYPRGVCPVQDGFAASPGYRVESAEAQRWQYLYRIACSVDRINSVVASLIDACLPDEAYAVLVGHWRDDEAETYLSPFMSRLRIQSVLEPHLPLLYHDGMVGFGLAWYDADGFEEVFVDDHKEISVFCSEEASVDNVLAQFEIPRNDSLSLLSENPHAHTNLGGPESAYCRQVIKELNMRLQRSSK